MRKMSFIILCSVTLIACSGKSQESNVEGNTVSETKKENGVAECTDTQQTIEVDTPGNLAAWAQQDCIYLGTIYDRKQDVIFDEDYAKYSYFKANGELLVPQEFDWAEKFSNGLARVRIGDKYGCIDKEGKYVIAAQYDELGYLADNGLIWFKTDKKYGYMNQAGEIIIKPQFDDALSFDENGLAQVKIYDSDNILWHWGIINENGDFVTKPIFDTIYPFTPNGLAKVETYKTNGIIDCTGKVIVELQQDFELLGFSNDFAMLIYLKDSYLNTESGSWDLILIDKTGKRVVLPRTIIGFSMTNGWCAMEQDGKHGAISAKGEIIKAQFEEPFFFSTNGLAHVTINGKHGYIDQHGKIVIAAKFDDAGDFSANGLAPVKLSNRWGFITKNGNFAIEPKFEKAEPFSSANNMARVKTNGQWGCIDSVGNFVVPPLFDIIWRISDDGFSLVSTGCRTKWGILDKNGKFIVEPKYDFVGFYDSGMAVEKLFAVKIGDNWGYVDKTGKMVIEPQFKEAGRFLGNYAIVAKDEDYSAYNYGIIDTTGTYMVKPIYNNIDIVYRGK